jgi:hypothetical protein
VLTAFAAHRTDGSLVDFRNTEVFADIELRSIGTRRTSPDSTPSSSDASPRCPSNGRLSSTAEKPSDRSRKGSALDQLECHGHAGGPAAGASGNPLP